MKFLYTIGIFLGLLISLIYLDGNPFASIDSNNIRGEKLQFKSDTQSVKDGKKSPIKNQETQRSPASGSEAALKEVTHLMDGEVVLKDEIDPQVPFALRAKKYYLDHSTIVATWEKNDQIQKKKIKVVVFEPKAKNKYPLLRMEQPENTENGASDPVFMVADHVMVTLADSSHEGEFEAMMSELGVRIRKMQARSHIYLVEFNGEEKGKFESVLSELNKRKDIVKYAEPDYLVSNL